jgi:hypothetical protein
MMTTESKVQKTGPDPTEVARAYMAGPGPIGSDFDFVLGDWEGKVTVYAPDGSVLQKYEGSFSAQSLFDGRMIEDRFVPRVDGIDTGACITLRTYCVATAQWEMVILWAQQPIPDWTNFVGNRVGDEMHLSAQHQGPDGQVVLSRIRFHEITSDSFTWEHRSSFDDGDTWHVHTVMTVRRNSAA